VAAAAVVMVAEAVDAAAAVADNSPYYEGHDGNEVHEAFFPS
jgi:hypothetical protein